MSICTGNIPIQRMRHGGEILAAYLGSDLLWVPPANDWLWQSDGSQVMLLLYHGSDKSLHIPPSVEGLPVTALAPTACNDADAESVTIPSSVKILA